MAGKRLKIFNRVAALVIAAAMLSVYGCNKGQTIDPDFYPTPVVNEEETTQEGKTAENITEVSPDRVSDEDILKPERNTLKEDGEYVYNPVVIPDWILKSFENNPQVIKVAKQALLAINNCETEFKVDEDIKLTQDELQYVYIILYYSNPISTVAGANPTEDPNKYEISYYMRYSDGEENAEDVPTDVPAVTEVDPAEAKVTIEAFKEYVTETINSNLTSDMSEREMAAIIYKQLLTDIKLEVNDVDYYQSPDLNNYDPAEQVTGVLDKKFSSGLEFNRLYSFFMTQLHIDTREVVGTSGFFTNELKEELKDMTPISSYWSWQLMQLDGEYFNCDITLEAIMFTQRYKGAEGAEPDMLYFGMSDKKRIESYKNGKSSVYYGDTFVHNAGIDSKVPDCLTDLDFR